MKIRLDQQLVVKGLVSTRSQAESYIKLGQVKVGERIIAKPGYLVNETDEIKLSVIQQYVSRAALKLASVASRLNINFQDKIILDVGSSTGGFTDYALRHSARQVIAIDVGTNQLHPSLQGDKRIILMEQTDIRSINKLPIIPDLVLIDVSFISLQEILPTVALLATPKTVIVAMVKPQFEAGFNQKHKGVIKNETMRRNILKSFENWVQKLFKVVDKADSEIEGAKGNLERFYILKKLTKN